MDRYFEWLKIQVNFIDFPETYDMLFEKLYKEEFRWKHLMDKNRAFDGIELRNTFHEETGFRAPSKTLPCNVLELLVSLSRRMNYICASFDEDKTKVIFWRLIFNLDLMDMYDEYYYMAGGDERVSGALSKWMDRLYNEDGSNGGLFPMQNPRENQREVEIWYQMNQYLSDPNGEDLKSY